SRRRHTRSLRDWSSDVCSSDLYTGRLVFAALCDKLFDVTPELKIVPQLATGHEWAPDNKSVVIKLRPGVKFHDGEPLNAAAVRRSEERRSRERVQTPRVEGAVE